jgi:hypothetical protein
VTVAEAYTRIGADARFEAYSDAARALLAVAWADGDPLMPGSRPVDAEVLVVAEVAVRHGAGAREALERARSRTFADADLPGAARCAAARLEDDPGLIIRELTRQECVLEATRLFSRQADPFIDVQELLRRLEEMAAPEPEPLLDGPILGACHRCGAPVCEGYTTISVWYFVRGLRGKPGRHEWRAFTPSLERGDLHQAKRGGSERRSELIKQARSGETPLLCRSCTTRSRYKLIDWPDVDEFEFDERLEELRERA